MPDFRNTRPKPKYGIDTNVMDYLMGMQKPPLPEDEDDYLGKMQQATTPGVVGVMADAAAKMGTLGGQQADASPVQNFAKGLQQQQMQGDRLQSGREQKLAQYLGGLQKDRTARGNKILDMQSERDQDVTDRENSITDYGKKERIKKGIWDEKQVTKLTDKKNFWSYKNNDGIDVDILGGDNQGEGGIRQISAEDDAKFNKALSGKNLSPKEAKAIKQVAYRYQILRANLASMRDIVEKNGTVILTGPEAGRMKSLTYQIAVDFAKLVDPESVAREGEVKAAQAYLMQFIDNPWTTRESTAIGEIDALGKDLNLRLGTKLKLEGLGSIEEIEALTQSALTQQKIVHGGGGGNTPVQTEAPDAGQAPDDVPQVGDTVEQEDENGVTTTYTWDGKEYK